jgi:hypothetical protein
MTRKTIMKDKEAKPSFIKIEDKKTLTCDYEGGCKNKAHKKVFPSWMDEKQRESSWSYLCKKHFDQERKALKSKLGYSSI